MTTGALTTANDGGWPAQTGAYHRDGVTYFGYVDGSGNVEARTYDHGSGTVSAASTIRASLQIDHHNSPALLRRASDGRILTSYCQHGGTALFVKLSTNPDDVTAWGAEANIDSTTGGTLYTYPNLFQLTDEANDPIYLFYRDTEGTGPTETSILAYTKSTDGGVTWSAQTHVWEVTNKLSYWRIDSNGTDRIDVFTSDGTTDDDHADGYHFYYTGGNWFETDGSLLSTGSASLPLGTGSLTAAYSGAVHGIRTPYDLHWNDGNPIALVASQTGAALEYYYVAYVDGVWQTHRITGAGATAAFVEGGLALDHERPNVVFLSKNVDSEWHIFRYQTPDNGSTWVRTQLTTGSAPHFYPVPIRDRGNELKVLWLQGTFVGETNFSLAIWGSDAAATSPGVWIDWNRDGFANPDDVEGNGELSMMMPESTVEEVFDNITLDVMSFDWTRGGSATHTGPASADGCTITVKNTDGKFNVRNTASPLYGLLNPHLPVWIGRNEDMTLEGTGQTVFGVWAGYTRTITPLDPVAGMAPTAQIICEGAISRYERAAAYVEGAADRTHVALRGLILDSMEEAAARRDLDAAEDGTMDYSWVGGDNREIGAGIAQAVTGLSALNELNSATGTRHFIRPADNKDDWYQYVSVHKFHKVTEAADFAVNGDDVHRMPSYLTGEETVVTYQEAEFTPVTFAADAVVWGPYPNTINLTNLATRTVWGKFDDYVRSPSLNITSSGDTVNTTFATYGRLFRVDLWTAGAASVTVLSVNGEAMIRGDTERTFESANAQAEVYGRRNGPVIVSPFVGSTANAYSLCRFIIWKFSGPRHRSELVIRNQPAMVNGRDIYDTAELTIDALNLTSRRHEIVAESGRCDRAASGIVDWTTAWDVQECRNQEPLTADQLPE